MRLLSTRGGLDIRIMTRQPSHAGLAGPDVTVIRGDISDNGPLTELLVEGCTVINLVHVNAPSRMDHARIMRAFVEACCAARVRRLIHCSTAAVAGQASIERIDEDTPCVPSTDYELAKLTVEDLLLDSSGARISVSILRPTAVFGPYGRNLQKLASDLHRGAPALNYLRSCFHGRRRMNLVHVDNAAAALVFLAEAGPEVNGRVFIVSDDEWPSNNYRDVEVRLMQALGVKDYPCAPVAMPKLFLRSLLTVLGRSNTNPDRVYDCSRLLSLGFKKIKDFELGLSEYGSWYRGTQAMGTAP